ncbi:DUF934 domain-containing protein [Pseudogulbenkiania subflava]|uniref:Uncharacterized conserved protein, DUF934 family n=1 Tax=Pseudogulbenkiania subflava DSM 22618 TaxID=1123014 RepID=A0A1Y6BDJ1_9NEIS|nr:DUF934 domain-containing protein [Pseudogulbenkiania subflava]SMF05982.1 Uncharacterized conserved protein, DUF934 family [Pseudogulbenkiania subflava DSM 22618]
MKHIIRVLPAGADIVVDEWLLLHDSETALSRLAEHAMQRVILPLPLWRTLRDGTESFDPSSTGVWIASDDEYEDVACELLDLPLIAVDFPSFRDGRGYSVAYLLRTRYGFRGELRAIGDVLRDQLFYMRRCGFDSFEVRADKDIRDALKGLAAYTIRYQGSVDDPVPLFRKRAEAAPSLPDEHWEP